MHPYVIKVPLGVRSYTISIGSNLLSRLGHECKRLYLGQRCAVITDRNVAPHYGQAAVENLKAAGFEPTLITVPAGETAKSLKVVASCYDQLAEQRLERKSFVVALGGGVVGDLAGFVAASFLRGIDFVQIPTTLLAQGPGTNVFTTKVTDNGTPALSATNSFTVTVNEVNSAPVLPGQTNRTINELTTLTVTNTASDGDLPANVLTYQLVAPPTGASISASGVISWTPSEAQGPSTNTFRTIVTDNGTPALRATNSFTVTVNEVNSAPVLPGQTNRTINELTTLTVTNTATDSDLPANVLTYQLVVPPTGASISASGVISWTPSEAQGPSTNTFTTIVTDNGTPALSATNSFTVTVNEVNSAPVLAPIASRTNFIGHTVSLTATATDSDLPTNTLLFSLGAGAPAGATIDPNSGVFNWPVSGPSGSTNAFTVVVTDNGTPSMSATQTFRIVAITAVPPTTQGIQIVNGNVEVTFGGIPGEIYSIEATQNLNPIINWIPVATNLVADDNGLFKFVDTQARTFPMRFFRAVSA